MNFTILFVLSFCIWNGLPAFSILQRNSFESLTMEDIREPSKIEQNLKLAVSVFVKLVKPGNKNPDDFTLIKLGFLAFHMEKLVAEREDIKSSRIYGTYERSYHKKIYSKIFTSTQCLVRELYTDVEALDSTNKLNQKNLESVVYIATASILFQKHLDSADLIRVFSVLVRLAKTGHHENEIKIILPDLIEAHSTVQMSRLWKAKADDPIHEKCISNDDNDGFAKFNIFFAMVGIVKELKETNSIKGLIAVYTLSDKQASGFKKLLMDLFIAENQTSINYGKCAIYSIVLNHYKARGLTEQGYDNQFQAKAMTRIMRNVKEYKAPDDFDLVILEVVMQHFNGMDNDERSGWIKDMDLVQAIWGLHFGFDYHYNKLGETEKRFYVLATFPDGNDTAITACMDLIIPLLEKESPSHQDYSDLFLAFRAVAYATESMRTVNIASQARQKLLENENKLAQLPGKLEPYLRNQSNDFKTEYQFLMQQIKALRKTDDSSSRAPGMQSVHKIPKLNKPAFSKLLSRFQG